MTAMPESLDGYTIVRTIGSGDFADTLLGERDGESVAIKLARATDGDAVERLRTESRILSALSHPAIPAVLSTGEHDGRPYLIMQLAPGTTLREVWRANVERNGRLSDIEALRVAAPLFDALAYLQDVVHEHGVGWVHRDIKDANVLASSDFTTVTLIDFGFCKEEAASDRRLDDSFFRAGAARYSPPRKLEYSATASGSHDVFGVGVLLYQLLTNEFPWSVPLGARGELSDLMRNTAPTPIGDLNSVVRREVASLITNLIETRDEYRPTAKEAGERVRNLLASLEHSAGGSQPRPLRFDEVWRDPLLGDVRLTAYERAVIDTKEMQRLREIKQLGLAYFVYDGARHSRLGHAVGCLQRVEDILRNLGMVEGVSVDNETRESTRLYALTHDVTHIPLGHTLEDEYGFFRRHDDNHERISRMVLDSSSELGALLSSSEPGREVLRHFDLTASVRSRTDVEELVSGPVGADVLDYIDRDAYFCGLSHRVDTALLRQLRLVTGRGSAEPHVVSLIHGQYGLRADREFAVESLFNERYALFLKIYTNKTKIKASALVAKALTLALHGGKRPAISEREIELLSDAQLINRLATARRQNERESVLLSALRDRRLPEAVYRGSLLEEGNLTPNDYAARIAELQGQGPLGLFPIERRLEVEDALARIAGLKVDQVFVYATPNAPGYKRTQNHRFLINSDGGITGPSRSWFNALQQRHLRLWDLWVFADPIADQNARSKLADAAQDRFGLANRIGISPRADALF